MRRTHAGDSMTHKGRVKILAITLAITRPLRAIYAVFVACVTNGLQRDAGIRRDTVAHCL